MNIVDTVLESFSSIRNRNRVVNVYNWSKINLYQKVRDAMTGVSNSGLGN